MACPNGSEPQPGVDAWFTWSPQDITDALVDATGLPMPYSGWMTLDDLELPSTPQETSFFCEFDAPTELPTVYDWAALASPPVATMTGAYERFANAVKQWKWSKLCQCKANPNAPAADQNVQDGVHCDTTGGVFWQSPVIPAGSLYPTVYADYITYNGQQVTSSGTILPAQYHLGFSSSQQVAGQPPTNIVGQWSGGSYVPNSYLFYNAGGPTRTDLWAWITYDGVHDGSACFTLRHTYNGKPGPTQVQPPVVQNPPDGYPTPPGCPTVSDLQGVADMVCSLQKQNETLIQLVRYLAGVTTPATYTADAAAYAVAAGGETLDRPADAVGVQFTFTAPTFDERTGRNPEVWRGVGYVTPVTPEGFLASTPLHYNPHVIYPIPPVVTNIAVDLRPGATASYRWLRAK